MQMYGPLAARRFPPSCTRTRQDAHCGARRSQHALAVRRVQASSVRAPWPPRRCVSPLRDYAALASASRALDANSRPLIITPTRPLRTVRRSTNNLFVSPTIIGVHPASLRLALSPSRRLVGTVLPMPWSVVTIPSLQLCPP